MDNSKSNYSGLGFGSFLSNSNSGASTPSIPSTTLSQSNISISSQFSSSTLLKQQQQQKISIKNSPEYRKIRHQLFHLQHSHEKLKLTSEREISFLTQQKAQFQAQVDSLKATNDEVLKDQKYIFEEEARLRSEFDTFKKLKLQEISHLKSQVNHLENSLSLEKEAKFSLEKSLTQLRLKSNEQLVASQNNAEFDNILTYWKNSVLQLKQENSQLKEELQVHQLKPNYKTEEDINVDTHAKCDCEELRRNILTTYTSLEAAQSALLEKRSEAERLTARIGNVKILEERLRDAQLKIKRIQTENEELQSKTTSSPMNMNMINMNDINSSGSMESVHSSNSNSTKLFDLTKEMGDLKEKLSLQSSQITALTAELSSTNDANSLLKKEHEESTRLVQKLQSSLKLKDLTISSLSEQLDSTVNLLTEKVKSKK